VRYDTQIKDISVGNFPNEIIYGTVPYIASLEKTSFEFNTRFMQNQLTSTNQSPSALFFNSSAGLHGLRLFIDDATKQFRITYYTVENGSSKSIYHSTIGETGKIYDTSVKWYNNNIYITIDGVTEIFPETETFKTGIEAPSITVGARKSGTIFAKQLDGEVFSVEYYELNSSGTRVAELVKLKFSETNGPFVLNTAADAPVNSHMDWILGGSTEGTQWGTSAGQRPNNLIDGCLPVLYFGATERLSTPSVVDMSSKQVTFDVDAIYTGDNTRTNWIFQNREDTVKDGTSSWFHISISAGKLTVEVCEDFDANGSSGDNYLRVQSSSSEMNAGDRITGTITQNGANIIVNCLINNSTPSLINGTYQHTGGLAYNYTSDIVSTINYRNNGSPYYYGDTAIISLKLTVNGSVIIDVDNTGKSIGMSGDSKWMYIPDTSGDGKTVNKAESVYDRNFADAPKLVLAGIQQDEDIGYEEITDDISRFYDTDGNLIDDILVYSDDYLAEPIAGENRIFHSQKQEE
jgi:hypothetical protein